jgi:hypothetical protein
VAAVAFAFAIANANAKAESPPLGAFPLSAGSAQAFAFDPRRPEIVYVATVGCPHGTTRGHMSSRRPAADSTDTRRQRQAPAGRETS